MFTLKEIINSSKKYVLLYNGTKNIIHITYIWYVKIGDLYHNLWLFMKLLINSKFLKKNNINQNKSLLIYLISL